MSHPDFTDKPTAPTAQGASGSGSERPLTRGKWTFYGDGLIEYEYTPRIGKVQRVCGILGKNKAVSRLQFTDIRELIIGNDQDSQERTPRASRSGRREI